MPDRSARPVLRRLPRLRIPSVLAARPLIRLGCVARMPGSLPPAPAVRLPAQLLPAQLLPALSARQPAARQPVAPHRAAGSSPLTGSAEPTLAPSVAAEPSDPAITPGEQLELVEPPARGVSAPLLVGAACLLVSVLLVAGFVLLDRSTPGAPVAVTPVPVERVPTPTDQLAAWALRNLPGYSTLLTDAAMREQLIRRGYPGAALTVLGRPVADGEAGYLVVTPRIRQAARRPVTGPAKLAAAALAGAQPLAVFGGGAGRIEVSQLDVSKAALAAGRQARLAAGRDLLRNRNLVLDRAVVPVVAEGRLDLRTATLLAVLAGNGRVRLIALEQDPAEQRAGAAIRAIAIRLSAATGDQLLTRTLAALSVDLRPVEYTAQRAGYQLVWLPDRIPSPPVG